MNEFQENKADTDTNELSRNATLRRFGNKVACSSRRFGARACQCW